MITPQDQNSLTTELKDGEMGKMPWKDLESFLLKIINDLDKVK